MNVLVLKIIKSEIQSSLGTINRRLDRAEHRTCDLADRTTENIRTAAQTEKGLERSESVPAPRDAAGRMAPPPPPVIQSHEERGGGAEQQYREK